MVTMNKPKKVNNLRHAEYYDMQPTFDNLFARATNGEVFSQLNQSSITEEDGLEKLKAKIDYSWFEEEMPDKLGFIDSLLGYIFELEQDAKPETIRLLANIDELVVIEFLDELKGRSFANIKNFGGYIKKMFLEFLRQREIMLAAI